MAIAPIEMTLPGLKSFTDIVLDLFAQGVYTPAVTGLVLTFQAASPSTYITSTTAGLTGTYLAKARNAAGTLEYGVGEVVMDDTTSNHIVVSDAAAKLPANPAAVGSAMTLTSGERDAVAAAILDLTSAIEANVTLRQAIRAIAAKSGGLISGAGTGTEAVKGLGQAAGGTTRLTATVDLSGNITGWVLNL